MKNKELEGKEINFTQHYREMWPFVKPYWGRALLAILICIPVGALDSVIALALKPYMDNVLVDKSASSPIYIPFLIVAFTTVQGFLNYAATYLNTWVGTKINHDLKRKLFKKLMTFESAFYDQNPSGYIIQRFTTDADTACTGLLDNLKLFISRFFSSVSLIVVLIYNSWQLAIIAIIVLLCALLPLAQVKRRIKGIIKKTIDQSTTILTHYNESYAGNKTIASYNLQDIMYIKFNQILINLFKLTIKMVQKTGWMTPLMHVVVSIGVGAVIGFGSYLIVNGTITSGNFVSFITALILLYTPIKGIGKNFNNVQVSFLAIERILDIINTEPKIFDKPNAKQLSKVENSVSFENVDFGYVPETKVLKNINLDIKAGSTIAFVGNSGGGKTTIVSLLPRFYDPQSGAVKIDGTDIRDFSLKSLRDNIAVVFQDNFLFSGTIRENILLGNPEATEEDIKKALKMAYLEDFVASLENGMDTNIGERGTALSGGQRQRLAIARAIVKNAPIVILDEATSALDNKSEAVVQKAIDNLMTDRTVFVIAHRLSTIQNADMIVVLNNGEIVEEGTHEQLMQKTGGAYYTLYNAQFKNK